ncbi:hypothetical protein B484DRAFT_456770 [Ochromonadaceae sp. CCMP2298]|nr:hypothetical protein B484DRAFT_456770 [Ochromonadaceae sp. CCMP2298]
MDQNQNQNGATKLESGCRKLAAESYKCLETNPHAKCKPFFDSYRECSKREHDKMIEERRKGH